MNKHSIVATISPAREDVDAELYTAMLLSGAVIPTTAEEVAFVEAYGHIGDAAPSGNSRSPLEALEYGHKRKKERVFTTFLVSTRDECREELARAAREGHDITSEVEERMNEARRHAEGDKSED